MLHNFSSSIDGGGFIFRRTTAGGIEKIESNGYPLISPPGESQRVWQNGLEYVESRFDMGVLSERFRLADLAFDWGKIQGVPVVKDFILSFEAERGFQHYVDMANNQIDRLIKGNAGNTEYATTSFDGIPGLRVTSKGSFEFSTHQANKSSKGPRTIRKARVNPVDGETLVYMYLKALTGVNNLRRVTLKQLACVDSSHNRSLSLDWQALARQAYKSGDMGALDYFQVHHGMSDRAYAAV